MKPSILIFLFIFGFHNLVSAKTIFRSVPKECQRLLLSQSEQKDYLKPEVDWTELYEELRKLGYPEEIANQKILGSVTHQETIFAEFKVKIQTQSKNANWQLGDKIPVAAIRSMVRNEGDNFLQSIPELPYLASVKNIDVALIINEFLKFKSESDTLLDSQEVKRLVMSAPLWLRGPKAIENAKLFFLNSKEDEEVAWVYTALPKELREVYAKSLKRNHPQMFDFYSSIENLEDEVREIRLLSSLPWKNLPASTREGFELNYLDFKKYPPLKTDSIESITYGYEAAGSCQMMSNGHINCLNLIKSKKQKDKKASWKNAVFIRVKGQIVGEMKLEGDPSMIALRNVIDSEGRVIMAIGGVYHLGKDFHDIALVTKRNAKGFRVVDFDSLQVHPHSFLMNNNAWSGVSNFVLFALALNQVPKQDILDLLQEFDPQNDKGMSQDAFGNVRFGLVELLDQTRRYVEEKLKP